MTFTPSDEKMPNSNRLKELAKLFFAQIRENPEKFDLTKEQAKNITIEELTQELLKHVQGKQTQEFVNLLFYKLITDGINRGFYQTKDGKPLRDFSQKDC